MSTRLGNSRVTLPDGRTWPRARFERFDDGRAVVMTERNEVLHEWTSTTLEPTAPRTHELRDAEGALLATITTRGGCRCNR